MERPKNEIQLRTPLQHAFATAVETVTTFMKEPFKQGGGGESWRRFFALMGSAMAIRESTPPIRNTPDDRDELVRQLRDAANQLNVRQRLEQWGAAISSVPLNKLRTRQWILLVLDVRRSRVSVETYADTKTAVKHLRMFERLAKYNKNFDAVLVGVGSIRNLRRAYPNYFADTTAFVAALNEAIR